MAAEITPPTVPATADVVVVGAGAAGLMTAIWAARTRPGAQVVVLDGARRLGAKILVSGGRRCNVTHHEVSERDFAGSTPPAIRKVLRRFDVEATVAFFEELGVRLKREDTGKLFPTTDKARTVLDALLGEVERLGVRLVHPARVTRIDAASQDAEGEGNMAPASRFALSTPHGAIRSDHVVLATGGKSLPKTGSDGAGYALAKHLGHQLTPRVLPALVPLLVPEGHFVTELSGLATPTRLQVQSGTGRVLHTCVGPTLLTHFGLSGPAVLDVSRHLLDARRDDPAATLSVHWLPDLGESIEARLRRLTGTSVLEWLEARLPARLAGALLAQAGVATGRTGDHLRREERKRLVGTLRATPMPVTEARGWAFAEVTAGGVPLREVRLEAMASRRCPGLHLVGEILDVDGRIGGFNFQWAWASGFVAGSALGRLVSP